MKKLAMIAACGLLAACGAKKDEATPAPSEAASASASEAPVAAYTPAPGNYDYTEADGTQGMTSLIKDGSYVERNTAGKVFEKGKWAMADGQICFTPEKGEVRCFGLSTPGADGSFTATNAKGEIVQVKPRG